MAKILIVDDDPDAREIMLARLKTYGYEVKAVVNGWEGVESLKDFKADLILMDIMMPKLDGYKVCGILKSDKRFAQIPVVILSSRAGEDDIKAAREAGSDVYMVKPFDQKELNRNIKQLLNK